MLTKILQPHERYTSSMVTCAGKCTYDLVSSTVWSSRGKTAFGMPSKRLAAKKDYKSEVRDYFAGRGPTYESTNTFHPLLALKLVDLVPLKRGDSVLDIATGTGYVAFQAAKAVGSSGAVLGIDISGTMLRQVRRRTSSRIYSQDGSCGSNMHLPFVVGCRTQKWEVWSSILGSVT